MNFFQSEEYLEMRITWLNASLEGGALAHQWVNTLWLVIAPRRNLPLEAITEPG